VEKQATQQVVGQNVIGLSIEQVLEFLPRLPSFSIALVHQGQQQSLVDRGVTEETPAFGAEFVGCGGLVAATGATGRAINL